MALTINPATKVVTIPQADLTFVSGTLYEMDTNQFRLDFEALLDDEAYIWMPPAFTHNTEVTVAGTTFARTIEMINGWSITFSPDSQWTVRYVGSNNNLFDVENGILNQNQVQVISANSAGLIVVVSGSGLNATQDTRIKELHERFGLSDGNPMTATPTSIVAGSWSQTISGDGETTSTVTRDP